MTVKNWKRLVQKRDSNSLAIKKSVIDKYFDEVQEIQIETKSKGTFRIHINDLVLEGKFKDGEFRAPIEFWQKIK